MPPFLTRRRLVAQVPYLVIALIVGVGFVLVLFAYWRRGLVTIGAATVLAGALRLLLPVRRAGLLTVRSRGFDVAAYVLLGIGLIGIGLAIPPPAA